MATVNGTLETREEKATYWIKQHVAAEYERLENMPLVELLKYCVKISGYRINPTGLPGTGNVRQRTMSYLLGKYRQTLYLESLDQNSAANPKA